MRLYLLVNKIQPIGRITEQDQSVPFCCFFDNSNTNKKNNFSAIAARHTNLSHNSIWKSKELCTILRELDIYITRWQNVAVFLCWHIFQYYLIDWPMDIIILYRSYLLSREEMKKKWIAKFQTVFLVHALLTKSIQNKKIYRSMI